MPNATSNPKRHPDAPKTMCFDISIFYLASIPGILQYAIAIATFRPMILTFTLPLKA